jgi:hypothetical protein
MTIANELAVLLGDKIPQRMPVRIVHAIAAAIFAIFGVDTLLGAAKAWDSIGNNHDFSIFDKAYRYSICGDIHHCLNRSVFTLE